MKYDRIVIAVDFSEHSIAAAQWVARHFAPRANLVLVHVLELPPPPSFWPRRVWLRTDDIETYRVGAKTRLRELGAQIGSGVLWEEVRQGRPEEEVLRVSLEFAADLIVVGSHRERDGFWNRFGSTAERILGGAEVPVLIVHGAPRSAPRLLLAGVDDTLIGEKVIGHARALAERLGATGRFLHVLPSAPHHLPFFPGELVVHDGAFVESRNEMIHATHEWLRERIADDDAGLTPLVQQGHTPEVILREARLAGADLLVLGRERKGTIRRHLLGSVTGTVIRGANCPVLVIPSSSHADSLDVERASDARAHDDREPALDGAVQ
jgi:nucleotide-binding universal stress UspA family protein